MPCSKEQVSNKLKLGHRPILAQGGQNITVFLIFSPAEKALTAKQTQYAFAEGILSSKSNMRFLLDDN